MAKIPSFPFPELLWFGRTCNNIFLLCIWANNIGVPKGDNAASKGTPTLLWEQRPHHFTHRPGQSGVISGETLLSTEHELMSPNEISVQLGAHAEQACKI